MKTRASQELSQDGFNVFQEPLFPPTGSMGWGRYRPDLLGIESGGKRERFAIIECETHPNTRRLNSKNFRSVWFQAELGRESSLRRIVVIPTGSLGHLDSKVRYSWEIWIALEEGFQKFPALDVH